jgi:hypothetical protein
VLLKFTSCLCFLGLKILCIFHQFQSFLKASVLKLFTKYKRLLAVYRSDDRNPTNHKSRIITQFYSNRGWGAKNFLSLILVSFPLSCVLASSKATPYKTKLNHKDVFSKHPLIIISFFLSNLPSPFPSLSLNHPLKHPKPCPFLHETHLEQLQKYPK